MSARGVFRCLIMGYRQPEFRIYASTVNLSREDINPGAALASTMASVALRTSSG
jgi:hypothetical protein